MRKLYRHILPLCEAQSNILDISSKEVNDFILMKKRESLKDFIEEFNILNTINIHINSVVEKELVTQSIVYHLEIVTDN